MPNGFASRGHSLMALAVVGLGLGWALPGYAAEPVYTTETAATLPSSNTGWDYITLDQATGRLFIARRADGLTVWDTKAGKDVAMVEDSKGANGVVLVPEFNRGYTAMTDGTMLVFDYSANRVLIACRGDKPVFVAVDPADGRVVAKLPIGRGVDGMAHDEEDHLLITANSVDGSMSVIWQDGPDKYGLVETISTRSMARVIAMDAASKRLFTVTAGYTQAAAGPDGKLPPPVFHRDSFTVLTYARQ